MKILHVYRTYYPDTQGGLEEVIRHICLSTGSKGVTNRVFTLSQNPAHEMLELPEADIVQVRRNAEIASCSISISGIRRFVQEVEWADLVHYHYPWPFADILYILGGKSKPSLLTYHSDIVRQRLLKVVYAPLMKYFLGSIDRIVATSPNYLESSKVLEKFSDKVDLVPIGLYEPTEETMRMAKLNLQSLESRYGRDFFLFIGVLRYYKGLHILLDAIKNAPYEVVIVGAGPIEDELKRRAVENKLDNVHFLGHVSDEEKICLLMLCRAVVFPSYLRSEAFGVTLLEGAMFSKPLISAEIGTGTTYVNIHEHTGLVVNPGDCSALRSAMDKLYFSEDLARKYGNNARRRYEELFTADKMGALYMDIYAQLVDTSCH